MHQTATLTAMTALTPRREATVSRLVEAAITQFSARGIDATSVEQLCEAAGFTRGAFYSNFSSKDDLCLAIIEHYRDNIMSRLADTIATLPAEVDVESAADVTLTRLLGVLAPHREMMITLLEIRLRALRIPELMNRLKELHNETRPALIDFVEVLAARLDIEFALPIEQIIDVFEALYAYETNGYGRANIRPLLTPLAIALIRSAGDGR